MHRSLWASARTVVVTAGMAFACGALLLACLDYAGEEFERTCPTGGGDAGSVTGSGSGSAASGSGSGSTVAASGGCPTTSAAADAGGSGSGSAAP